MAIFHDTDIDPSPLAGKRVAVLGFGNQGRAQALNLRDSGIDVVVGLREGSPSESDVNRSGLTAVPIDRAPASADLTMFLAPDEALGDLYRQVEPRIREGSAIGFSHGLAVHFGLIEPRPDLDVLLVAPKGPGAALRTLYEAGDGMVALIGVAQDSSGKAQSIALAYGKAIGCARAGLIGSSFAEECEADLFNEQAVVWGSVPELLVAGFDVLVEAGISPEVAYLECVGELKLIAELIERRGIAGMRDAISNTAELGATIAGPHVIDRGVRDRMRDVLADVRSGRFAAELKAEFESGYPRLKRARAHSRTLGVEQAFDRLRSLRGEA